MDKGVIEKVKIEPNSPRKLERRRYPRFKDNIFMFTSSNLQSIPKIKACSKDVSGGGLAFETDRKISVGTKLRLEIYQPLNSNGTVILSILTVMKVVWRKKITKNNFEKGENEYKVGMKFIAIKERDRQRIIEYINNSR